MSDDEALFECPDCSDQWYAGELEDPEQPQCPSCGVPMHRAEG